MLFCVLLFSVAGLFAAADSSVPSGGKSLRLLIVAPTKGPLLELNAYMDYVCLSTGLKEHDQELSLSDQLLLLSHEAFDKKIDYTKHFRDDPKTGWSCIEKAIEAGLQQVSCERINPKEVIVYGRYKDQLNELTDALQDDALRTLWLQRVKASKPAGEERLSSFLNHLKCVRQARIFRVSLERFHRIIISMLATQFYLDIGR